MIQIRLFRDTSDQDGETDDEYTIPLEKQKLEKIMKLVFKLLGMRQWRTVISEIWETNDVNSMIASESLLAAVQKGKTHVEPRRLPELRSWS